MSNDQMRAQFQAWANGDPLRGEWSYKAWQAAYRAGMERAAEICERASRYWRDDLNDLEADWSPHGRALCDARRIEANANAVAIRKELENAKGGDANA